MIEMLLHAQQRTADYGGRLTADLTPEQAVAQPAAAVNHAAWVLSHLNAYLPVMAALIRGDEFPDPKDHEFGMKSKPLADASLYAPISELRTTFLEGNQAAADALREAGPDCLDRDMTLERWKTIMPKTGIALSYLMLAHQNLHLGQLSAWRRVQGLPSV